MNQSIAFFLLAGLVLSACTSKETPQLPVDGSGGATHMGAGGSYHIVERGSGGAETESRANSGLKVCELGGVPTRPKAGQGTLIDNFDDGDIEHVGNGTIGFWIGNDDGTSGTQTPPSPGPSNPYARLPQGSTSIGGVGDDGNALHVVGSGYSTWGSTIGVLLAAGSDELKEQCAFDATSYDGISFWLKGKVLSDTNEAPGVITVQVLESDIVPEQQGGECDSVHSACWDAHEADITPTECWRFVSIPFVDLTPEGWGLSPGNLDLDQLSAITFVVAQKRDYDYWIDELQFYSGAPPKVEERCADTGGMGGMGGNQNP